VLSVLLLLAYVRLLLIPALASVPSVVGVRAFAIVSNIAAS
jgi:hypothetical protein